MEESTADKAPPLSTIVIAMSIPETTLAAFRAEFPEVRFRVPGEAQGVNEEGMIDGDSVAASPDDLREADGFIGWSVDAATLANAPGLRWLHASGAGVERYDLALIAGRGLTMTNSSGVSAPNMAEHILGMMIALARRFPTLVAAQSNREWRDSETHDEVAELQGQTVLIAGIGDIGLETAKRADSFGMRVLGLRRRGDLPPPPNFEQVFAFDALPDAVAEADHVIVTLPHTPQTRGMFDAAIFAAMKTGAIIYNVGRGPVIDSGALVAALASGHLGGAGLDVTDPEPLPADSPLWAMPNVLITAHTSGATPRYWDRQGALIARIIRAFQDGDPVPNNVDLEAGY